MEKLLNWLSLLQQRFVANKKLLSYENLCLNAWRESLDEKNKFILDDQLASLSFIQRQADNAKICFFFNNKENIGKLFTNHEPNQHVADVLFTSDSKNSKHKMHAKIFVHRGRFFSIEFPKRPDRFMDLNDIDKKSLRIDQIITKQEI